MRGRRRELRKRLAHIRELAAVQQPVQESLLSSYQREAGKKLPAKKHLDVSPVGANALPVATVEVTRKTLPALAAQPDVVAVLPNQKVHLIQPKELDYAKLIRQEAKDGLTWGLKELEFPPIWETTKGGGIRVAVLDTGVHGDHPALAGRVDKFVVVDPLGRRITTSATFDADQHGTHVCGTVAGGKTSGGVSIGVAPEATLLVTGVLVGAATLRTLVEGISWAVENGADIISMSLGFTYYEPLFAEFSRSFSIITAFCRSSPSATRTTATPVRPATLTTCWRWAPSRRCPEARWMLRFLGAVTK